VRVVTGGSRSQEGLLWEEDIPPLISVAKSFHKSILIHKGPGPLVELYLYLLRKLGEQRARRRRAGCDSVSV